MSQERGISPKGKPENLPLKKDLLSQCILLIAFATMQGLGVGLHYHLF